MTGIDEVLKKEVYKVQDIQVIFQCGQNKAYQIMREIHAVSNILGLNGRVHRKDYEKYINRDVGGAK